MSRHRQEPELDPAIRAFAELIGEIMAREYLAERAAAESQSQTTEEPLPAE